jgi:ankyrin repeat protein
MIAYLKRLDQQDLTNTILNKVNPHSHLSTLAYSILNHHQTERENFDISKMLIEFGARSYYGETDEQKDFSPIFMAVQKLNQELLELMCDHGASLTVKNSVGMTPLMFAAEQNYQIIVNYLSLRTRDLNEEDSNSITILVHQLFSNNLRMASRLIVRGARIDYVNRNGNTALHLCVENKLKEAVEFLLFKGANPHIMDLKGEDACDKAKANGMAQLIPEFNNCSI